MDADHHLMISTTNDIRCEFMKRQKETNRMSSKVCHAQESVQQEMACLVLARQELSSAVKLFIGPLELSKVWSTIHCQRPVTAHLYGLSLGDPVSRAMNQTIADAKSNLSVLVQLLEKLDKAKKILSECSQNLTKDMEAKNSAMLVDNVCIKELVAIPPTFFVEGSSPNKRRNGGNPMGSSFMRSSTLQTGKEWENVTISLASSAHAAIESSLALRKEAHGAIGKLWESGQFIRSSGVMDALKVHVKQEKGAANSLTVSIKWLEGQIAQKDKQLAALSQSLKVVREQLHVAFQRSAMHSQMLCTVSEPSRTGVEDVLEVQAVQMKNSETRLLNEILQLEKSRNRCAATMKKTVVELEGQMEAIEIDKRCMHANFLTANDPRWEVRRPSRANPQLS